ncbi:protamine-like [Diabrotica virgifera virgifera]|uniref:Protamine-like n=1 Tax=Diabrotica virgifera virgifera TaxID=50390 RepID=A0ABM5K170_DIAVI|nr:protamine-like [Diabrotica virgifera virgifera]
MARGSNESIPSSNDNKEETRKGAKTPVKYKPGRITRNPFLNFLRIFRKNAEGMSVKDIAIKGGNLWRKMDQQQKKLYLDQAKLAPYRPRVRRRNRSASRGRGRSKSRSKSRSASRGSRRKRRRSSSKQ